MLITLRSDDNEVSPENAIEWYVAMHWNGRRPRLTSISQGRKRLGCRYSSSGGRAWLLHVVLKQLTLSTPPPVRVILYQLHALQLTSASRLTGLAYLASLESISSLPVMVTHVLLVSLVAQTHFNHHSFPNRLSRHPQLPVENISASIPIASPRHFGSHV